MKGPAAAGADAGGSGLRFGRMATAWISRLRSEETLRILRWGSLAAPAILAAVIGVFTWGQAMADAERRAEVGAGLVRDFMLRLVETHDLGLTAADAALDEGLGRDGGSRMHRFLAALQARIPRSVGLALVSPDGTFLLSSAVHPPRGEASPADYRGASLAPGQVFVDRIRAQPMDADTLIVARRRAAAPEGIWVSGVRVEAVEEFLGAVVGSKDDFAAVIRGDGRPLVERASPPRSGAPGPGSLGAGPLGPDHPLMRVMAGGDAGFYEADGAPDETRRIHAYARVGDLPIYAHYGVSKDELIRGWLGGFAGVLGVLGAVSLTGYGLMRTATRSLEAEAAQVALEFNRRLLAEAEKTAEVREMMFKELNHRIKNSLQMVRSLIRLQANRPQGADLGEISSRIMAIATIHDLLYRSANSFEIDLGGLIAEMLASDAIVPPEAGVVVRRDLARLEVDANVATPVALCVIELVTNAAKHAFGPEGGAILVGLRREGTRAVLVVADDGRGLPAEPARSSGLRVVDALVRQLDGTMRVERDGGTRFEIAFPVSGDAPAA